MRKSSSPKSLTGRILEMLSRIKHWIMRWPLLARVIQLRYSLPWTSYRKLSVEDRNTFEPTLSAWRPSEGRPRVLLRWMATEWCNYGCPYCTQTHSRTAGKGRFTAHAFDNFPREQWQQAFLDHFQEVRLSLVITGGEPMIDRKAMVPFLETLTAMPTVECIRIDTNASWDPKYYDRLDRSKIILMCTFHPSQVSESDYLSRIDRFLDHGFSIGMINYVMDRSNFERYADLSREMQDRGGPPLHPNPLWDSSGYYSSEDLELMKRELPEADFLYRSQVQSPKGEKCLFPTIGYEMDQTGHIQAGCYPFVTGSFFDEQLPPAFAGPVPCPYRACTCLDKYSFLGSVNRNITANPLQVYSDLLKSRHGR